VIGRRAELGKWRRLDDAAISNAQYCPRRTKLVRKGPWGCGAVLGNAPESDFYDLTIFVDLSNSGPTEFHGGNAKDIAVLVVGYSFRSDVIFAQGYEITNITPDRVNCPDPDPIARAAAYQTCRPMFLDYKLDP
jgi:hypothetical protein